jgi:hypothetical protein
MEKGMNEQIDKIATEIRSLQTDLLERDIPKEQVLERLQDWEIRLMVLAGHNLTETVQPEKEGTPQ